jgi:hypothetical protein
MMIKHPNVRNIYDFMKFRVIIGNLMILGVWIGPFIVYCAIIRLYIYRSLEDCATIPIKMLQKIYW